MKRLMLPAVLLAAFTACLGGDPTTSNGTDPDDVPQNGHDPGEPPLDTDARDDNLLSGPGDFAIDYLRDDLYDKVIVEVDYVTGHEPSQRALDALEASLLDVCRKPAGVQIIVDDQIPPQGSPAWAVHQVEALELSYRDRYRDPGSRTAVVYMVYLDGHADSDTSSGRTLAYAYHGSSVGMFEETISSVGGGLVLSGDVEDTVIVHEMGHLLGLVNNGVGMVTPHQDSAHGHHDNNDDCIMYWAVETDSIVDVLLGSSPPTFDGACRDDMIAAGGRP